MSAGKLTETANLTRAAAGTVTGPVPASQTKETEHSKECKVSSLPKFVLGHPDLGSLPADPENDEVWEI
jgi:hypothetical protein